MLAQNFKTAADLGISEVEHRSLVTVLGMLERGEIDDAHFNMSDFLTEEDCGTVGCICGWAHHVSNGEAFPELSRIFLDRLVQRLPAAAREMFAVSTEVEHIHRDAIVRVSARASHGATALRSYLTSGEAKWREALRT